MITHVKQMRTVLAEFPQVTHLLHGILVIEEGVVAVPLVDDTSPTCPTPDAEDGSEEVVIGHVGGDFVAVEACYHADALVICIAVKKFLAEGEEGL